jgi:hypothetical protein
MAEQLGGPALPENSAERVIIARNSPGKERPLLPSAAGWGFRRLRRGSTRAAEWFSGQRLRRFPD